MSKVLTFADEQTAQQIKDVMDTLTFDQSLVVKVLSDESQNTPFNVKITTPKERLLSNGVILTVTINEEIFDRMPDEMQLLGIKEALHPVVTNNDVDYKIETVDVKTYSTFLEQLDDINEYVKLIETIKSIKDTIKNKDKKKTVVEVDESQSAINFTDEKNK